jgi:hypothetical protein
METEPRYDHDCDACVYLGQYEQYDLYYCPGEPTIVCRYSSDGPDYRSGLDAAVIFDRVCYQEGLVRALRNPEFRPQITKHLGHDSTFPQRTEAFEELCKIADTDETNYPLLINQFKTKVAVNYLETLLKGGRNG